MKMLVGGKDLSPYERDITIFCDHCGEKIDRRMTYGEEKHAGVHTLVLCIDCAIACEENNVEKHARSIEWERRMMAASQKRIEGIKAEKAADEARLKADNESEEKSATEPE